MNYLNFLTFEHIVNHFFLISSVEPIDLRGLPQILPQSTKFFPRACSWRSRKIPSLAKGSLFDISTIVDSLKITIHCHFQWTHESVPQPFSVKFEKLHAMLILQLFHDQLLNLNVQTKWMCHCFAKLNIGFLYQSYI